MSYIEYIPAAGLRAQIAAYWIRGTERDMQPAGRRVYADGCADLIYNAGDSSAWFNPMARAEEVIPLDPSRLYLGGTMTAYGVIRAEPGCLLTGIRFRPGGFYAFYGVTMEPAVDAVVEFVDGELAELMQHPQGMTQRLDHWFMGKAAAFLRIVRFQEVLKRLRQIGGHDSAMAVPEESLLRIAFELGYYDHAHLTNEFKKYAGILPSELSHFYKTGIAGGQYF